MNGSQHVEKEENGGTSQRRAKPGFRMTPVILCILVTETGERFAYFGFRAVLVLYFTMALEFDDRQAISLFAFTTCAAYLSPLLGAILADGWWGRYTTILRFGFAYVIGLVLLTVGAWSENAPLSFQRFWSFLGLFLVCLGTGGIKPCVSAFGADQVALSSPSIVSTSENSTMATETTSSSSTPAENAVEPEPEDASKKTGVFSMPDSLFTIEGETPFDPREFSVPVSTIDEEEEEDGIHHDNHDLDHSKADQVRAFFAYFYFCINVGAVTSIALVPWVRGWAGFGGAFLLACLFMMTAMILFVTHRRDYIHHDRQDNKGSSSSLLSTFRLCGWLLRRRIWSHAWVARNLAAFRPSPHPPVMSRSSGCDGRERRRRGHHVLVPSHDEADEHELDDDHQHQAPTVVARAASSSSSRSATEENGVHERSSHHHDSLEVEEEQEDLHHDEELAQQLEDAAQALHVMPIMCMFPIFWSLYDQQSSVWTLQAKRMALHGLKPEQLNVVNPLEIMIFIPLFDRIIYPAMESCGINISPLRRMSWGMLLTAVSFVVSGMVEHAVQYREDNNLNEISVFWQLPQITILAVGEIFLSVTGLEFAYATSPVRLKALIMALFLLTTAVGDFFSGILYSTVFAELNMVTVMYICAFLMMGNLALFCCVSKWWEKEEVHRGLERAGSVHGLEFQERRID